MFLTLAAHEITTWCAQNFLTVYCEQIMINLKTTGLEYQAYINFTKNYSY